MNTCPNCGKATAEGDSYCAKCGVALGEAPASPAEVPGATESAAQTPAASAARASEPPAEDAPESAPPASALPPGASLTRKRSGAALALLAGAIVLLCACTAAAGVGTVIWRRASGVPQEVRSADEDLGGATNGGTTNGGPANGGSSNQPPSTSEENPAAGGSSGGSMTSGPAGPLKTLDEKSARGTVQTFLDAIMKDDVKTASTLLTPSALRNIGGPELLKQSKVVTGYTIQSATQSGGSWQIAVVMRTGSGPARARFTVTLDNGNAVITDWQPMAE